jgi:anaphase-promoting complex subunit 10
MESFIVTEKLDAADSRELGSDAVFTISSSKPGNGVEQLRDNSLETYWQSDGQFPHFINIQFLRKVSINKICLYLDYSLDESYTPKKIAISHGASLHDLVDLTTVELNEPNGWIVIELNDPNFGVEEEQQCLRTHLLQVKVLAMHQNGRDTHVRQIKILGPRNSPKVMANVAYDSLGSSIMREYAIIR